MFSRQTRERSAGIIAPPPRLKPSEWAERFAYLPHEGNEEEGKYHLSRMPHQQAMLDDPVSPGVREIFWMVASQLGKTMCLIFLTEYAIHWLKKSIIMVRATKETALDWMRDKFIPTVDATPCMDGLLTEPRKRGSNSTSTNRKFPGGSLKAIGAKSPASFRGTSASIILQDEIDSYVAIKEGDPCALADRAAKTFSAAWKIKSSTTTLANFSRIHAGYKSGNQEQYFLPCPCCGEFQWLKTEQLKFSFTAEESARLSLPDYHPNGFAWEIGSFSIKNTKASIYICEHCHRGWTDSQRIASYLSGHVDNPPVIVNGKELRAEWRATAPFNGIRSRAMSGMYQTIGLKEGFDNYLQQFADDFLVAKAGGRETLMVWYNLFKNEPFEDAHEKLAWETIRDRAEDYPKDQLPAQVVWVNFAADIQQDRVEILFYGWGDAQETWALEHHVIYGDFDMPLMQERVWDYLSNKKFKHPILGEIAWSAGVFDSGHQTKVQAVYSFCAKHRLANVFSCKGFDQALGAVYQRITEKRFGGIRFNFNVDYLKNMLFDRLKNTEVGPRYIHFSKTFQNMFFTQLCSERRMPIKQPKGGVVWHWVKHASSTRNEILDMTVYCFGLFEVCRQDEWIARKWKDVQAKIRELNPPEPVEKREVMLNQPAEAKVPELKQPPAKKPSPFKPMPAGSRFRNGFFNPLGV